LVQLAKQNVTWDCSADTLAMLGAAQYRGGQYAEAVTTPEEAVKRQGRGGSTWMQLFLALAHQQRQQLDQARAWLAKVKLAAAAGWEERLVHQRLRAAMERLLKGDREGARPFRERPAAFAPPEFAGGESIVSAAHVP
jgi:Flp pilus assembly protein TadD